MDIVITRARGFSLIELLTVLTLVGVVAAIGSPPLSQWLSGQRVGAATQMLLRDLQQARHQTVLTSRPVVVCPLGLHDDCELSGDWSAGWISFFNDDNDQPPRRDAGEPLLTVHRISPRVSLTANRRAFHFRGDLRRATNGSFVACDVGSRALPRVLVVSYSGRPRLIPAGQHTRAVSC